MPDAALRELWALSPPPLPTPSTKVAPDARVDHERVLEDFRNGVAEVVQPEDAATHYELGIAYREMGLYDDAVAEFEIARRHLDESRVPDAEYMRALTLDESGRHVEAIQLAAMNIAAGVANMRHVADVMLRRLPRDHVGRLRESIFLE